MRFQVPPGLGWILLLLLQHASTIGDSRLCRLRFYGIVAADTTLCHWMEATLDHLEAHRIYSR